MQSVMRREPGLGAHCPGPAQHRLSIDHAACAARVRAWTVFWNEQGDHSRCLAFAPPEVRRALDGHWSAFAARLAPLSNTVDLGCGTGAVARILLAARGDLRITGIDSARIAAPADRRIALTQSAMERLPFEKACFDAAVSQFGFEYGHIREAALTLARVLAPGAPFSFLVHHAHSAITCEARARNAALDALLGTAVEHHFLSGNALELDRRIRPIQGRASADALVGQVAQALRARVGRDRAQRSAVWTAIAEALAPEREILVALETACVAPGDLSGWLANFPTELRTLTASAVRTPAGQAIAWRIEGVRLR